MPRGPGANCKRVIHRMVDLLATCCVASCFILIGSTSASDIHDAVESHAPAKLLELLRAHPEAVNSTNNDYEASLPIHFAAAGGYTNVLTVLLENGAEVNATNKSGRTPLHEAALRGRLEAARLLLQRGARLDATDASRQRPLDWATEQGYADIVELFLARGAQINGGYWSPLDRAARHGHESVVRTLLAHNADVNSRESFSQSTPLISAASLGWTNTVRFLLEHKANVNAQTTNGYSALSQAARYGKKKDVVEILLPWNPTLNSKMTAAKRPSVGRSRTIQGGHIPKSQRS